MDLVDNPKLEKEVKIIKKERFSGFIDFLQSVVIAVVICLIVYIAIAMPNQVEGQSMQPNFYNNDIILTNKLSQWLGETNLGDSLGLDYHRGDVIVFQKPGYNDFIKRLIGLPGDKVALKDGIVYVNGEALDESQYLQEGLDTLGGTLLVDGGDELFVPEAHYFVMGDNRKNSHDSRYIDIGFIKRDWLKGKVVLKYWPINEFHVVKDPSYN